MCLVAYSDGQESFSFQLVHRSFPLLSSDIFFSLESSPNVGSSFTTAHKDWNEGMYENFKAWSVKQFGLQDLESGDEADVPVNFMKAKDISFEKNRHGAFILPPFQNYSKVKERQRVIRGYVGAVYSKSILGLRSFLPDF
jgi:hypothetical protein